VTREQVATLLCLSATEGTLGSRFKEFRDSNGWR
jgi:hypothetical protein